MTTRTIILLHLFALLTLSLARIHAQTTATWNGSTNGNWTTATNWDFSTPPDEGSRRNIIIGGTINTTITTTGLGFGSGDPAYFDSHRLTFNNTATSSYTIVGTTPIALYDFGGNRPYLQNDSTATHTLDIGLRFDFNATNPAEINANAGGLVLNGPVYVADSTDLIVSGTNTTAHNVTINGVISSDNASTEVFIRQNKILTLGGANTYTGETLIEHGELRIAEGGSLNGGFIRVGETASANPAKLTISDANGGTTVDENIVIRSGTGARTIESSNTSGTNTYSGAIYMDGNLTVQTTNAGGTLAITNTGDGVDIKNQTLTVTGPGTTTIERLRNINPAQTGALVKNGSGTLSLIGSAANDYRGNTTVNAGTLELNKTAGTNAIAFGTVTVNTGGTLLLSQDNQIANTVNMTLAGGTFNTGGNSETLGNLSLTANSIIDFGSGASILTFANFSATPGTSLTIQNWTGVHHTPGGTDQLIFTGTGLPAAGIYYDSLFNFSGHPVGYRVIAVSGGFEVVPIPEPSTYAALCLIAILAAAIEIRRRRLCSFN